MYALLRDNMCVGIHNLRLDEATLSENEKQIEWEGPLDPRMVFGKIFSNGQFIDIEKTAVEKQAEMNLTETLYLKDTDWKVIRHRDQLALGIPPSLTDGEYKALLEARQQARNAVVNTN